MNRLFRHEQYRDSNPDLQARFDAEDDLGLYEHFKRFGRREMRGMQPGDYIRIEGALFSDRGDLFIVGWADRRMFVDFAMTVDIGYLRFEFTADDLVWHRRDDVSVVTGDTVNQPGFLGVLQLDTDDVHGPVVISVAGLPCYTEPAPRYMSRESFLDEALAATAILADRPAGQTASMAARLLPMFQTLWRDVNATRRYTQAFSFGDDREVDTSIVIVLYRRADMLLVQLTMLADFLEAAKAEVVVVANLLDQPDKLVRELVAFTQIHAINLRLFLCSGNAGFSAANNFGARTARGRDIVFMNPDIFPPEDQREQAFRFLQAEADDGLTGALLYYGDGMLMHSGMYVAADRVFDTASGDTGQLLRVEHFGKGLMLHVQDALPPSVEQMNTVPSLAVTAALWKIRKDLFFDCGGLPEDYIFAYYEDADFAMRLLEQGVPVKLDTHARFIHLEGVGGQKSPKMRTAMWLNRVAFSERFAASPHIATDDVDRMSL